MPRKAVAATRIERHAVVVREDLPSIYAFIAADNASAAEAVLDAIEQTFQHIARYPGSGVSYRTRNAKLRHVRMFPVKGYSDYLIFYRAEANNIRILYVTHGARNLFRLFRSDLRE